MVQILVEDDDHCFACGMENQEGLRIQWKVTDTSMTGEFIPEKKYQSWRGIVHGGIIATLLDESMARLACALYGKALTAEIVVRYIAPAKIGQNLYIRGEVVKESRKLVEMKAEIHEEDQNGSLIAHAIGKIFILQR